MATVFLLLSLSALYLTLFLSLFISLSLTLIYPSLSLCAALAHILEKTAVAAAVDYGCFLIFVC